MDLPTMLANLRSPDGTTRAQAETMMQQATDSTPGPFLVALVGQLGSSAAVPDSRQQAGLYIKNVLIAEDDTLQEQKAARWADNVDEASKAAVRAGLLQCLLDPEAVIRHTAAQDIGAVAALDIPNKRWGGPSGLIPMLLQAVTNPSVSEGSRESALEACGYMCEQLEEGDLEPQQTNEVLTAIVDGIKAGRPDATRLAATKALMNSLDLCGENFNREGERNMLMTVVCDATQCSDARVRGCAYECVGRVCELYYEQLEQRYMDVLYPMTVGAIKNDDEDVAMLAVEFWSTLCETEMNLDEGFEGYKYMEKAMPHLMPTLLATLERQNEDADDEDWNLASAASVCIQNIAQCCEDKVVEHVLPYVSASVSLPEWRKREAALLAFGSILDGPVNTEAMQGTVRQALPVLVAALADDNVLVKDTAAWSLSRVAELHPGAMVDPQVLMLLLTNVMSALDAVPRVAEKACLVVRNMAENRPEVGGGAQWLGPQIVGPLLHKLVGVTDRPDWEEHNLRVTAYEAINMVVESHQDDCRGIVLELSTWVFGKLQASFAAVPLSEDDKSTNAQLQGLLVSTLFYIVSSCEAAQVQTIADTTMQNLLQVIAMQSTGAAEEAFMAAGKLMDKIEGNFNRYLGALMPLLIAALKNAADYQLCAAAVGACGDLCRAVEAEMAAYCDPIMQALLEALENPALKRDVKPPMLSVFGDLALAIGPNFVRYLQAPSRALVMLYQAGRTTVDPEDDEMVDYLSELHEAIIEAYTGIANGLTDGGDPTILLKVEVAPGLNGVGGISEFLATVSTSAPNEEVIKGAVGLVGDLAKALGKHAAQYLAPNLVTPLLQLCEQLQDEDGAPDARAAETVTYARQHLTAAHAP